MKPPQTHPYAEITPTRFGYSIRMGHGPSQYEGGYWRPTRRSAERLARRWIGRQTRRLDRSNQGWTVHP